MGSYNSSACLGYVLGLYDRLAGCIPFDRMFYQLRGWLDRMGGVLELCASMGGQTGNTHTSISSKCDAVIMSTSSEFSMSVMPYKCGETQDLPEGRNPTVSRKDQI